MLSVCQLFETHFPGGDATVEKPSALLLSFYGGRDELRSRLSSATSILVDRRQPLDIICDDLEKRGVRMAGAA